MGSALGWSFGGVVAHELAVELQRRGCLIARLILFDAQPAVDDRADRAAPPDDALGERQVPEASRSKRLFDLLTENLRKNIERYRSHRPGVFNGDITIFAAARDEADHSAFQSQAWRPHVSGEILGYALDCAHNDMLTQHSVGLYDNDSGICWSSRNVGSNWPTVVSMPGRRGMTSSPGSAPDSDPGAAAQDTELPIAALCWGQ